MKRRLWIVSFSLATCLMGSKSVPMAALGVCDTDVLCTDVVRDCSIWCTVCTTYTFEGRHCG
jgi:hypothetical protein